MPEPLAYMRYGYTRDNPYSVCKRTPICPKTETGYGENVIVTATIQGRLDRGAVRKVDGPLVTPVVLDDSDQTIALSEMLDRVRLKRL